MKRLAFAWASILLSWWVVYGYHIPPYLVAGPYVNGSDCQYAASEIRRVKMDINYHCEIH